MKKTTILHHTRQKAGMPGFGRQDLIRYVCAQLSVPLPATWEARYALMGEWSRGYKSPAKPVALKPPAPVVMVQAAPPKGESRRKRKEADRAKRDEFLLTYEWRRLRMEVIKERGRRCECCGAIPSHENDVVINVDHIKPRLLFPELALVKSNLQVLCGVCNHGKGNWDQTDWREDDPMALRLVKNCGG